MYHMLQAFGFVFPSEIPALQASVSYNTFCLFSLSARNAMNIHDSHYLRVKIHIFAAVEKYPECSKRLQQ